MLALWKKMSLTAKYMLFSLLVLFVGFAVVGFIVIQFIYPIEPYSKFFFGLLLGCVVTAIRLVMMDRSIDKTVDLPEKKAEVQYRLMFIIRYGILILFAVVLVVFNTIFGVWGGVIGVFCMQLSAYGAHFLLLQKEKKEGKKAPISVPKPKEVLEIQDEEELEFSDKKPEPFDVMTAPIEKRNSSKAEE